MWREKYFSFVEKGLTFIPIKTPAIKYYFKVNMDTFISFNSATKSTNGSRLAGLKPKLIANSIRQIPLLISEAG